MALKSKLFAGDPRIQAIADSDSEHVKAGDRGEHVRKIQLALNAIETSGLKADGSFGPDTATAVLQFKTKRNIVNRAYQTSADAIVGKLTIVALDDELWDSKPVTGSTFLRVIAPTRPRGPKKRHALDNRAVFTVGSSGSGVRSAGGAPQLSSNRLEIVSGQTGVIEVNNAKGGWIEKSAFCFATVRDSDTKLETKSISLEKQTFEILGGQPQTTRIFFKVQRKLFGDPETTVLIVVVHNFIDPNIVPTITPHDHKPVADWAALLAVIEQPTDDATGKILHNLCKLKADPEVFVEAGGAFLIPYRHAKHHYNWYLTAGHGADIIENDNIEEWVDDDANLRDKVAGVIRENFARKSFFFAVNWTVDLYKSMDFRNTFGGIDKLFIGYNLDAQTVTISFRDIYEWHPVRKGVNDLHDDDDIRNTNSLHAALVQMKLKGAADFWMVGTATFPMSKFGLNLPKVDAVPL